MSRYLLFLLSFVVSTSCFASMESSELYGLLQCSRPGYHCISVKRGETWVHLFPNPKAREIVMRLNRTNVALFYRQWLLIPNDLKQINYMSLSPFAHHIHTTGKRLLLIDLKKFAFAAYDGNGNLVLWGPATGGEKWCKTLGRSCQSAAGHFKIYRIQGKNCASSEYPLNTKGGAPMPWCMHYYKGFAIHGSTLSGFNNRSKGCIRLFDSDAKWLNRHFVHIGTDVIVER